MLIGILPLFEDYFLREVKGDILSNSLKKLHEELETFNVLEFQFLGVQLFDYLLPFQTRNVIDACLNEKVDIPIDRLFISIIIRLKLSPVPRSDCLEYLVGSSKIAVFKNLAVISYNDQTIDYVFFINRGELLKEGGQVRILGHRTLKKLFQHIGEL